MKIYDFLKTLAMHLPEKLRIYLQKKWHKICATRWQINYNREYKNKINAYLESYDLNSPEMFKAVEIETINRCNGACSFCPVNVHQKQRPYAKMDRQLFEKIIDQLSEMQYDGRLALFSNNEPFLDERIIDFCEYAKKKVGKSYLYLYTNGTLLTLDKVKDIMCFLDEMVIDNYDEHHFSEELEKIIEWQKDTGANIQLCERKRDEILTSRGGQAPNKQKAKAAKSKCFLPYQQFIIRPDGKVSLCCNDPLGKYTMGDLNKQSIVDVWTSDKYRNVRESMMRKGRMALDLCNSCDTQNTV